MATSLVVAAWVAAPGVGFSQAGLEPVANDEAQQQIFDAIAAAEASGGKRSAELVGPYTELTMLYLEARDYDLALAAITEALHVVRVNFGLYSLEQAPLLRLSGRVEEARGDPAAARTLEQEVLALARRNPNDLDTIPILRELADRRGVFGMQYRAEAINVLLRNELYTSEELRTLEMELVRGILPYGPSRTLVRGRAYEIGRDSLRRLAAYSTARAEPLLARVDALVAIADWDLLFKEKGSALEIYEEAYALLKQNGVEQSAIDRIFAPTVPVALPAFWRNPLLPTAESTAESIGYVEVAFEISKYGIASGIEVLDTSTSSNETVKRNFVNWIESNRFRPRVVGEEIARSAPVVARYYVRY